MREGKAPLNADSVTIGPELFAEILDSRHVHNGKKAWNEARFSGARFALSDADFSDTVFRQEGDFWLTTFDGRADFASCEFQGDAFFTVFVSGLFRLSGSTFRKKLLILESQCDQNLHAEQIVCQGHLIIDSSNVDGNLALGGSTFEGPATIHNLVVGGDADFSEVIWHMGGEGAYKVDAGHWLILDSAEFRVPARWSCHAKVVWCAGAVFRDSALIATGDSAIVLDEVIFEKPARLAERRRPTARGKRSSPAVHEGERGDPRASGSTDAVPNGGGRDDAATPRLVSARRADLGRLSVTDVDAAACLFYDARDLDRFRWTNMQLVLAPPARARRRVIAEEMRWRQGRRLAFGWGNDLTSPPGWLFEREGRSVAAPVLSPPEEPRPEVLAEVYRQLRKGREDAKDAPGAADFYYGEMEMRRHAAARVSAERALLWLYWAVSGYGLRASRAVLALVAVIVVGAFGMASAGYCDPADPFGHSDPQVCAHPADPSAAGLGEVFSVANLSITAGIAVSVVGAPDAALTDSGQALKIGLRLLGPLLIGLSLFAVRNRVKR